MVIKKAKCKCGKEYIDFDNQIGNCPMCAEEQVYAEAQQKILKNLTYMTIDAAFKIVLRLLTNEAVRIKIEDNVKAANPTVYPSHVGIGAPEASVDAKGLCAYIKKLFRRR